MKFKHLIPALLNLFDGEGGAAAPAAAGTATGDTNGAVPGPTRRGKTGDYDNVKFGKQPQATAETNAATTPDAGESKTGGDTITTSNTLEERRKAYEAFKDGEYKDLYTEDVQRIINRRFSDYKALEDKVGKYQPIIDLLSQRFNVKDDPAKLMTALEGDNALWSAMAEEAGMDTEAFMRVKRMERENAAMREMLKRNEDRQRNDAKVQNWIKEAEALKGKYKSFDLNKEMQNPSFFRQINAGVSMEQAYIAANFDRIMDSAVTLTAAQTEKKVVDSVRAKGSRPAENGGASQSAFTVKDDPSKWTKKDRDEVIKRVRAGEKIYL